MNSTVTSLTGGLTFFFSLRAREILQRPTVVLMEALFVRWVCTDWHQPVSLH